MNLKRPRKQRTAKEDTEIARLREKYKIDPRLAEEMLKEYQQEERQRGRELFGDKLPFPIPTKDEDP